MRRPAARYPAPLTLRISANMREALEALAERGEVSVADLVRDMLERELPRVRDRLGARARRQRRNSREPRP